MNKLEHGMTLRLELFVDDLTVSRDFYSRVLGFISEDANLGGYTSMTNGAVTLGLNLRSTLGKNHPVQTLDNERPGRGVEMVLEVDSVVSIYEHVLAQKWPVSEPLGKRAWGLTDFRLIDPDGYYLRITSRR